MQLNSLLVPTDFSAGSQLALRWARFLGGEHRSKLTLLHVVEAMPVHDFVLAESSGAFANQFQEHMMGRARRELHEAADSVALPGLQSDTMILSGNPAREIFEAATHVHADLIVMATHGRGPVSHAIIGSIAEKVLRSAPCPVLAVKSTESQAADLQLKRILFCTDLSDESLQALDAAVTLATRHQAHLDVLLVLADPAQYPLMSWEVFPAVQPAEFYRASVDQARRTLREKLGDRLQAVTALDYKVAHGSAAEAIVEESRAGHYDLIALSTHGRSGLKRALLGSVTERVIRRAACPVLAVNVHSGA